jgi:site-specific recombinase XerD
MQALEGHYRLRERQADQELRQVRLWPFHRVTAWRIVKQITQDAGLYGPVSTPKAFRHGFGAGAVQAGIPITLLQRWLGHARLTTTAIYTGVIGPEELSLAKRYWEWAVATETAS